MMPITDIKPRILQLLALLIFIMAPVSSAFSEESQPKEPFTIDDYFKIKRFRELALSSDGEMIAYAVESQSLEENKNLRHIYISKAVLGAKPELIEDIQDARGLAWIPGKHELAFMSGREETTQIFSYDIPSQSIQQHTKSEYPVIKFRFAADGQSLAYITQEIPDKKPSLYDQFQNGDKGILVDSDTISVYNFVDPNWPDLTARPSRNLWVKIAENLPLQAQIPGNITEFYWSSDVEKLSVTYVDDDMPFTLGSDRWASLGIYDTDAKHFQLLGTAEPPSGGQSGTSYAGGEWVPGEGKIFVQRIIEKNIWNRETDWALVDTLDGVQLEKNGPIWHAIEPLSQAQFMPIEDLSIYVNGTVHAIRSLYQMTLSGIEQSDIVRGMEGSASLFQFSEDFQKTAFVKESLRQPPEIFIWCQGHGSLQLTHQNETIAKKTLPTAKEVTWNSHDGVKVHGWLLEPTDAIQGDKPWPMITYVQGGPGAPVLNEFAYLFNSWPYPFEAYALNGMAVFIVHYRGMMSFGTKFANPARIDGEPIDDILSGIDYLVKKGIANPNKLAISGFSHGAWLASLAMTRGKPIRAASFAEGAGNFVTNYDLLAGNLNRSVHDVINGTSLYDNPMRYIELSPELYFKGLATATLFEAGAQVSAVNMLGFSKAAENAGMPAEFIIYPKTGHGISEPRLRKESATRNLDWFLFWLKGKEDPNPAKACQYSRWRIMRDQLKKNGRVIDYSNLINCTDENTG